MSVAFLGVQLVKNTPAMWETWSWSQGWEDPLEEGMATHSCILAWRRGGQRSLVGYSPWGRRVRHDWATKHTLMHKHVWNQRWAIGVLGDKYELTNNRNLVSNSCSYIPYYEFKRKKHCSNIRLNLAPTLIYLSHRAVSTQDPSDRMPLMLIFLSPEGIVSF